MWHEEHCVTRKPWKHDNYLLMGPMSLEEQADYQHSMPAPCFMLVSCLAYSSTVKLEVTCSSDTSVDCQRTYTASYQRRQNSVRTSDPTPTLMSLPLFTKIHSGAWLGPPVQCLWQGTGVRFPALITEPDRLMHTQTPIKRAEGTLPA
jgi:hypothetical protein